ncbi:cytochrome c oxidase assembly protein [Azohydromonas lata]|uniref:Cytochrome c oxidase assembly protein n=1 Tax=Azohydromonas lata TaxID=45677 RepID=A0ABU5II51_9BURK|nr:cytochrome c oxidase assembly protein [Azohydromonas lata]MDZ5458180.1 cytochrome c oxidase assembly protein [Azohydromonas lata]
MDAAAPAAGAGWEALVVTLLGVSALLYAFGLLRLWGHAGAGHGIPRRTAVNFALGWLSLAVALVGPLDHWAAERFAAHMLQHELLMLAAGPLLVLGRPLVAWTWALPLGARQAVGSALRAPWWRWVWALVSGPTGAGALHALALWCWHVPAWFLLAATHPGWHALQHFSFLGTALLLWWAVFAGARRNPGAALGLLFVTMLHSGALGALLTLAPYPWYGSSLEDQQLGGLLMWVPAAGVFLAAAMVLGYGLLRVRA